jgi:hypothetical protein
MKMCSARKGRGTSTTLRALLLPLGSDLAARPNADLMWSPRERASQHRPVAETAYWPLRRVGDVRFLGLVDLINRRVTAK